MVNFLIYGIDILIHIKYARVFWLESSIQNIEWHANSHYLLDLESHFVCE